MNKIPSTPARTSVGEANFERTAGLTTSKSIPGKEKQENSMTTRRGTKGQLGTTKQPINSGTRHKFHDSNPIPVIPSKSPERAI